MSVPWLQGQGVAVVVQQRGGCRGCPQVVAAAGELTETAPLRPCAVRLVPSSGSTAMSTLGALGAGGQGGRSVRCSQVQGVEMLSSGGSSVAGGCWLVMQRARAACAACVGGLLAPW